MEECSTPSAATLLGTEYKSPVPSKVASECTLYDHGSHAARRFSDLRRLTAAGGGLISRGRPAGLTSDPRHRRGLSLRAAILPLAGSFLTISRCLRLPMRTAATAVVTTEVAAAPKRKMFCPRQSGFSQDEVLYENYFSPLF